MPFTVAFTLVAAKTVLKVAVAHMIKAQAAIDFIVILVFMISSCD
jgi:hypothetical protein